MMSLTNSRTTHETVPTMRAVFHQRPKMRPNTMRVAITVVQLLGAIGGEHTS